MLNIQNDLLPCHEWDLKRWDLASLFRVVERGTPEQVERILSWSYSGCSAELSERLYEAAGQPYPFAY